MKMKVVKVVGKADDSLSDIKKGILESAQDINRLTPLNSSLKAEAKKILQNCGLLRNEKDVEKAKKIIQIIVRGLDELTKKAYDLDVFEDETSAQVERNFNYAIGALKGYLVEYARYFKVWIRRGDFSPSGYVTIQEAHNMAERMQREWDRMRKIMMGLQTLATRVEATNESVADLVDRIGTFNRMANPLFQGMVNSVNRLQPLVPRW